MEVGAGVDRYQFTGSDCVGRLPVGGEPMDLPKSGLKKNERGGILNKYEGNQRLAG